MIIGERIKQRRTELGLSVDEVAAKIGKARATVYRYENTDIKKMPADILIPLAKALNTTPAYLLGFSDEPASTVSLDGITNIIPLPETKPVPLVGHAIMQSNSIGEKIQALRLENHLTLEQVGNAVGVGKSTVRKWENGMIANMRHDKIVSLAKALNTTPAYLLGVPVEWLQGTSEQKEKPLSEPEELKENEIIIRGRDGSCVRKVLTPEQIQAFKTMVDSLPDAPGDI